MSDNISLNLNKSEMQSIISRAMYEKLSDEDKEALLTAAFDRLFEPREREGSYGRKTIVASIFDEAFDRAIGKIVEDQVNSFIETSDVAEKINNRMRKVVLSLLDTDGNGNSPLDLQVREGLAKAIRGY